ncbi:NAD(P)-dependent dehydrogenase, short-chain alcohol dehydrogenase family [Chishuiella changwenlii]|uniref:NAD(P)-dependent dehydrogenase, short-chain alcohol dehydrogenase family n=1 Tax=Chishuiella changwenlii TaxID=1434701 RepID=A0A1M6TRR1_9FLAO|nr:SDR family oxidoreductase [Chishuiella changwenlii]GGF04121.1 oxidoreductase [Chishuiella changwenlii]SHK59617.1 NAD(P)-dependent dehydrogenase, short-chain alcohol dehydrogenase family [Chishuiella changwenlii]
MDFINKNVVITGGSTGIGFATAQAFINEGANVWITSRSAENLQQAETKINSPKLTTVVSDTSNLEGISILEKVVTESGNKIDVLFLNAGIAVFSPIEHATEEDFDAQFNTNVKGYYFTLQKMIPHLVEGASVVFTSSTVATASQMYASVYSATKGAVNKIAHIAANELADRKIRVNIVSPGPIKTEGFEKVVTDDEVKKQFAATTAVQRLGNPDEIAKTVLFLSSDKASFITGAELMVDGGYIGYALK